MVTVQMTEQEYEEWINEKCAIVENNIEYIRLGMDDITLTTKDLKGYVNQLEKDVNNIVNLVSKEE